MKKEFVSSIYLVDDDQDDRIIFAEVLSEFYPSVKLELRQNGFELSELLSLRKDTPPDIIFLNVNMPAKNGFDCLREIRERADNLKSLKIIIYSTSSNPETIKRAFQLGADLYALKPLSLQDLKTLITKIIEKDWDLFSYSNFFK